MATKSKLKSDSRRGVKRRLAVQVRLTPAERDRLKSLSDKAGLQLSAFIRKWLGRVNVISDEAFRSRTIQVARIGNNLNQLARLANEKRGVEGLMLSIQLVRIERQIAALSADESGEKPGD